MKTVISVSQGSSEYDYDLETEFLGQSFRVIRAGADGDLSRAVSLLKTYHDRAGRLPGGKIPFRAYG